MPMEKKKKTCHFVKKHFFVFQKSKKFNFFRLSSEKLELMCSCYVSTECVSNSESRLITRDEPCGNFCLIDRSKAFQNANINHTF